MQRFRVGEIVIRRFLIVLLTLAVLASARPAYAAYSKDVRAAIAAEADGRLDDAIGLLTRAITTGGLTGFDLATAYDFRGNVFDDKGDAVKAISDYNRALKVVPNFSQALNDRGIAYSDLGNYDAALKDYNRAIELKPDFAQAYNNRGLAYHRKALDAQAIDDFGKAIQLNPRYAHAYYNRAIARHLRGDESGAQKDYLEAIRLDSKLEKPH
jgi:tetratricopeptide (TPR) repeat protein